MAFFHSIFVFHCTQPRKLSIAGPKDGVTAHTAKALSSPLVANLFSRLFKGKVIQYGGGGGGGGGLFQTMYLLVSYKRN